MDEALEVDVLNLYAISAISALLLVSAIAFFIVAYQRKIMGQKQLMLTHQRDHQERLLVASTEGQERERARLARELHDGVGAALSGTRMGLKQFIRKAQPASSELEHLQLLDSMLAEGLETVRTVSHDLMPAKLTETGFFPALQTLIDRLDRSYEGTIELHGSDPGRLTASMELGLYRCAQELLHNGIRHSQAARITLDLMQEDNHLLVVYEDNGNGVDLLKLENNESIGLQNLLSRVTLMQGKRTMRSSPGQGFWFRIKVPLPS